MRPELKAKLENLKNRATTYEYVLMLDNAAPHGSGRYLLGYGPKSKRTLITLMRRQAKKVVALTGAKEFVPMKRHNAVTLGEHAVAMASGRTKREALIGGELDFIGNVEPGPPRAVSIERENDRSKVMAFMYYRGEDHERLTRAQWESIYLLADGFGKGKDRAWAVSQCWDWSHVRDSSQAAFEAMWDRISALENAGELRKVVTA